MTMPFGPALEMLLKDPLQGGKITMMKGLQVHPRFFCCLSGNTVGVAKDPVAVLIVNPTRACTGANINADYSHSWSPTSTINAWSIDWGDGSAPSNGAWPGAGDVNHPGGGYALPGIYTITLTVTDLLGATGEDSQQVEIIDCSDMALGVFAGCGASGIWYTGNCGSSWEERGGGVLEGVEVYDLKVHPFSLGLDKQVLWAATANGLYRSIDSGESWRVITVPEPESGVGEPTAASIVCSTVIENEAYVLAYTTVPSNRVWLYRTIDGGETWTHLGLTAPKYLFGVSFASRGHVWHRFPVGNWIDRDRVYEGSVVYWESNDPTFYKAHTKSAATGGGLFRWDPFAWTLIGANRECPVDMVVRANSDLAVIESGCCTFVHPSGCDANPYVRIYGTNEVLKDTIALPVLANTTKYVYITEFNGELYVSRVATYYADFAILRYDALSSTWIEEWKPNTASLYANSFAEHEGQLYASIASGIGAAPHSKKLLVRSLIGGTWDWDTIEASDKIRRMREFNGKLYIVLRSGGGKIQQRTDTTYKDIIATGTSWGIAVDFVLYGGSWFLVTHLGGGGPTRFYRWDADASTWVQEKECPNAADTSSYRFVPKHFAEEPESDCTISNVGRTHLTSMSADGQYVYAAILDSNSNPVVVRAVYDLSEVLAVHAPGAGSWGGVKADYTDIARVWAFGDFGAASKVLVSDDWGDTLTDVTDGGWGAGEIVRPVLPSIYDSADVVAILNTALESWRSRDTGATWVKTGDLAFACHCGERDWIEEQNLFVGRLAAGAAHLQFSPNRGTVWAERSGGITANAPIVALQVVS